MKLFIKVLCLSTLTLFPSIASSRLLLETMDHSIHQLSKGSRRKILTEIYKSHSSGTDFSQILKNDQLYPLVSSVSQKSYREQQDYGAKRYRSTPINRSICAFLEPQRRYFSTTRTIETGHKAEPPYSVTIVNPCIDSIFQYGFSEPKILAHFLNSILGFTHGKLIEEIEYLPRDMLSSNPVSSLAYHFTVDVRCRTKDNRQFLIEMQNDFRDDYHLKSLTEHSRMISRLDTDQSIEDQSMRSEKNRNDLKKFWKGIQGLYKIVITNKSFPQDKMKSNYPEEQLMEPFLLNSYELRHVEQLSRHYGDVPNQLVLLMLDNLKEIPDENSSLIERWSYLFKDSSLKSGVRKISETEEIPNFNMISKDDWAIKAFVERVKKENIPQDIRESYLRAVNYYNETILDIENKAETRGKLEASQTIAFNLLNTDVPLEKISQATGFSISELEKLKQAQKS